MGTNASWVSVSLGVPPDVRDALDQTQQILETVSTILEVINGILDIIKVFLIDLDNPLAALVEALLAIIEQLLSDFYQSGLYMYVDGPRSPSEDPALKYFGHNLLGGMPEWRNRMAYSFYNAGDPNRPQFSTSASVISFTLVVSTGSLGELYSKLGFLINMLGDRMLPNMEPPRGIKAKAVDPLFHTTFYDDVTGLFSQTKLAAYTQRIKTEGTSVVLDLGGIVEPALYTINDIDPVLRYDLVTGDEIVVDKNTGGVLATQAIPSAVLLTWKADQNLLPVGFQIEKSTTKGGVVELTTRTDTYGATVASNLLVPDESGRPKRSYETTITPTFDTIAATVGGQYSYLDETVDLGGTYYYRIRSKVSDASSPLIVPDLNLTVPFIRNINSFLLTLQDVMSGLGDPSEEVAVYLPQASDIPVLYNMHLEAAENTGKPAWSQYRGNGGWTRVSIAGLAKPLIGVIEELRNFVEALLASIQSGVASVVAFIELMQAKINTLNTFIEIIQAVIALLDAIALVEFGCLFVTTDNGVAGVLSAMGDDTLPGVPDAANDEYVASVTILGGTSGAGAALNAIQVLFGIS